MSLSLEEIQEILNNVNSISINIPNLYEKPYVITPITLNTQQYFFEYKWNNRYKKAYLSIFRIEDTERIYYVENICLIPNLIISNKIKNSEWDYFLQFSNKYNNFDKFYTIKDISENFRIFCSYRTD